MAEAKNIRLYTPEGVRIEDPALAEDYVKAEKAGPFRVGQRALFYRDGGLKRYCIPLGQIDHAFTRVVACSTHCCCGKMDLNTFRLVVCGEGAALPALCAIRKHGIRIPEELSVITSELAEVSGLWNPGITTIDQDLDLLAAELIDCVNKCIRNPELRPEARWLPSRLILRESVRNIG